MRPVGTTGGGSRQGPEEGATPRRSRTCAPASAGPGRTGAAAALGDVYAVAMAPATSGFSRKRREVETEAGAAARAALRRPGGDKARGRRRAAGKMLEAAAAEPELDPEDLVHFSVGDLPSRGYGVMGEIRRQGKLCDVTLKVRPGPVRGETGGPGG